MTEWLVGLTGKADHLAQLHTDFNSKVWRVVEVESSFYLKSSNFDKFTDHNEVLLEAQELLAGLKGAVLFSHKRILSVEITGKVLRSNKDGTYETIKYTTTIDLTIELPETKLSLEEIMDLAAQDQAVCTALSDFSHIRFRWVNWYKVLDTIKHDMGGFNALLEMGWMSDDERSRFTGPVNDRRLLRGQARHGELGLTPQKNPMNTTEAEDFIVRILMKWLEWKHSDGKKS
ncbi:MAG TPA: hypothetical protein VGE45_20075 [Chloroflexia bacterium]|jgi:hypothetical protein